MMEKIFKACILLNWKTGRILIRTKKPKTIYPFMIPVNFEVTIEIPEQPDIVAKGRVKLSEQKVKQMIVEAI